MADRCALCPNAADPRMGVIDRDDNVYALCDGCAPDATVPSCLSVIAQCIVRGAPSGPGAMRWWPHEMDLWTMQERRP